MWETNRKKAFSECNKTPGKIFSKAIFRMQSNTWKYFPFPKIFSLENILYLKNILHVAKHSLNKKYGQK